MIKIEHSEFHAKITVEIPHPDGGLIKESAYLTLPELKGHIDRCRGVRDELRKYYQNQINN